MNKKLLIVDDDVDIVGLIYDALCDLFDVVDFAYSVEEAWSCLQATSYSLVMVDINLNNRNGAEVIAFAKNAQESSNKDAAFVVVSGIINEQFIDHYRSRFEGIVAKPFETAGLVQITKDILLARNLVSVNEGPEDDVPRVRCVGPFVVAELEEKVEEVMAQLKKNAKLKRLFKQMKIDRNVDNYITTHIGMIINISAVICGKMEWNSDKTLEKFVYAAYLHDMSLANRPDLARIDTIEKLDSMKEALSEEEYTLVYEHANIAAKIVLDMDEIPPDVDVIIKQHHELPNERGFPNKCSAQKIAPLAAVFIVAHNLTDYILENPNWKMEDYILKARSRLHGSHFTKIMRLLADIKQQ